MKRMLLARLIAASTWPGLALAHATIERSNPGVNEILSRPPTAVTLLFDAELEPILCRLTVTDEHGTQVGLGDGKVAKANHKEFSVDLPELPRGVYRVHWNVVSRDGHRTTGQYDFTFK